MADKKSAVGWFVNVLRRGVLEGVSRWGANEMPSPGHGAAAGLPADAAREQFQRGLREVFATRHDERAVGLGNDWSTWGEVATFNHALEDELKSLPDGPVGLVLRNRPSGVAALLGLLASGRTTYLISPIQPPAAIAADARTCDVAVIVADVDDWSAELADVAEGIELQGGGSGDLRVTRRPWATTGGAEREAVLDPNGVAAIVVPTSGTTGPPKRIPIPWSSLPLPRSGPAGDVVINAMSSTTITGLTLLLRAMMSGRPVALLERLDIVAWAELVREHKPQYAGLPPAAMRMLLDSDVDPAALSSIRAWPTGSAPVPPALQEQFEKQFGIPVLVNYGATEFGGAVSGWSLEDHRRWAEAKRGSVGLPKAGVKLRVVDPSSGDVLAVNEVGLLEVNSPRALRANEWIRTNDLARIDSDGFVFIIGRADDVIIRGGFKVPLGEVEEILGSHPAVLDVGVVALPDARLGQVPAAAVTVVAGVTPPSQDELKDWVRRRTAPYKVPVLIEVVDALPQTTSHKVSRPALIELLEACRAHTAEPA